MQTLIKVNRSGGIIKMVKPYNEFSSIERSLFNHAFKQKYGYSNDDVLLKIIEGEYKKIFNQTDLNNNFNFYVEHDMVLELTKEPKELLPSFSIPGVVEIIPARFEIEIANILVKLLLPFKDKKILAIKFLRSIDTELKFFHAKRIAELVFENDFFYDDNDFHCVTFSHWQIYNSSLFSVAT